MPPVQRSNNLTAFAFALSALLAVVLAVVLWKQSGPTVPPPAPLAQAPASSPAPSATITEDPSGPVEAHLPEPPPTPEPTPPPTATIAPTPAATEDRTAAAVIISGRILKADGTLAPAGIEIFILAHRAGEETPELTTVELEDPEFELELVGVTLTEVGLCEGGVPTAVAQSVVPGADAAATPIELRLPGVLTLRGVVSDVIGKSIAAVPVHATRKPRGLPGRPAPPEETHRTATDAQGRYELRFTAATDVELTIPRHAVTEPYLSQPPMLLNFPSLGDATRSDLNIILEQGEILQGYVRTPTGNPVSTARVSLEGPMEASAESTADGLFRVIGLRRGTYTLRATAPGHAERVLTGLFLPAATQNLYLDPYSTVAGAVHVEELPPGTTAPTVATVAVIAGSVSTEVEVRLDQDGDGMFSFPSQPSGLQEVIVFAEHEGRRFAGRAVATLSPGANALDIAVGLRPLEELNLRLLGIEQHPASAIEGFVQTPDRAGGVRVELPPAVLGRFPQPEVTIGETGFVRIRNLERGRDYLFTVREKETRRTVAGSAIRAPWKGSIVVPLGGTGSVSGFIRKASGAACEGITVELVSNLASYGNEIATVEKRSTRTNYEGQFRFEAVPAGPARVIVSGDQARARVLTVPANESVTLAFTCDDRQAVQLIIFAPPDHPVADNEQLMVLSQPGTRTPQTLIELTGPFPEAPLQPGEYTLLRTSTMERVPFTVISGQSAPIRVTLTGIIPTPTPAGDPVIE